MKRLFNTQYRPAHLRSDAGGALPRDAARPNAAPQGEPPLTLDDTPRSEATAVATSSSCPIARWRNPLLVVLVLGVLGSCLGMWGLRKAGVSFPLWLDGETANLLATPISAEPLPQTWEGMVAAFMDHSLQTSIKARLTNNVPCRSQAIFANAALQRSAIQASNLLFRWPTYPTYYGSTVFALDSYGAVIPKNEASELTPGWEAFGTQLRDYATSHPDVEFVVYVAAEAFDRDVNPVIDLTTTTASTDTVSAIFDDTLAGIDNVQVLVQDYASTEEFYGEYFKGDNHWTIVGAVSAYNEIAQAMGLDALEIEGFKDVPGDYLGFWSRKAITPIIDDSFDITNDFSNLTISSSYDTRAASDHYLFDRFQYYEQFLNFILVYYDLFVNVNELTITSSTHPAPEQALFLCDSYGYHIGRPLANGIGHLDVYYWLSMGMSGDETLNSLIEKTGDHKVVMVAAPADYANMLDRYPHFFDDSPR